MPGRATIDVGPGGEAAETVICTHARKLLSTGVAKVVVAAL
jgi:hypothetical protein